VSTRSASIAAPADGIVPSAGAALRSRAWATVGALSVTETISWGILYYAFAVFLAPMRQELGFSTAQLTGAFSLALLVSAVAGIGVGRYLDRHSPRALMTGGSAAGVVLVLAWSRVHDLASFYAVWAALGVVMAAVLYEPAFTVVAKWFDAPDERRRALTMLTLVAALASFIFLPASQALVDAYGWRDALVVLAAILAAITVPLHVLVLRQAPLPGQRAAGPRRPAASSALRSSSFWLLSAAFVLASLVTVAMSVHAIPFLLERGYAPGFAAFAVGLVGVSQLPGRLLFGPLSTRLAPHSATAAIFILMAAGGAIVVTAHATGLVIGGLVLLGMGNGMATLSRATLIADLYGAVAYGAIAGVAGALTTAARAAGPAAAALFVAAWGYTALLWTLAALCLVAGSLVQLARPTR
jgi:MFS family permease